MKILKQLLLLFFCHLTSFAEELKGEVEDPLTNYVFSLPDLVANFRTLGEEVQLEAFGAREVSFILRLGCCRERGERER